MRQKNTARIRLPAWTEQKKYPLQNIKDNSYNTYIEIFMHVRKECEDIGEFTGEQGDVSSR
jgi:hypothetical protein